MTAAIVTRDLTKRFGRLTVVDGLDLQVRAGDRYGFLGPNGSGKSTTVRMLLGLVFATRGEIEVLGQPVPRRARVVLPRVGAIVEGPAFYKHLSGRANLAVVDAAGPGGPRRTRPRRVAQALERVGLESVDDRPVKAYSLGMRQRLGLAAALLRRPKLLVLDEPTNGLDPQGVREVRDLLLDLNRAGTTVFLSSHLLSEVEALCTRAAIISGGRLVVQDTIDALRRPTGRVHVRTSDPDLAGHVLGEALVHRSADLLTARCTDPAALNGALVTAGVRVRELVVERRSLEDVFVEMTHANVYG
ncbi:MAG TPA: ABC transporter ATP-binding protein [Frankiaceae bacterium]|nr:ABC transporter ATP-binding protein [Frankiaceae bacterium]